MTRMGSKDRDPPKSCFAEISGIKGGRAVVMAGIGGFCKDGHRQQLPVEVARKYLLESSH